MDLQVWSEVLKVYPKTYKEACCWSEKVRRSGLRDALYKRLMDERGGYTPAVSAEAVKDGTEVRGADTTGIQ